jgi:hypothetical protein
MNAGKVRGRRRGITDTMTFWRLWHDQSIDMLEIASQLRVTISAVRSHASRLGLKARKMTRNEVEIAMGRDPTELEIWGEGGGHGSPGVGGLTGQIRASWSPEREYQAAQNATRIVGDEIGRGRACGRALQAS